MHNTQITGFDEGFKSYFIENLQTFNRAEIKGSCGQLMLTEGARFFFERSNSYRIAQAIESILTDLAKTGETFFIIKLKFNKHGESVLTVVDEDIELVLGQPNFPIRDRDFRFYLYRDIGGLFNLKLWSEI